VRSRLGECLVDAGVINAQDLGRAIREHEHSGDRLGTVLARLRLATEEQIAGALAAQLGFPFFDVARHPFQPAIVGMIPRELARRAACIAIDREHDALVVAMADPLLFSLVQELEARTGCRIRTVVGTESAILAAVDACYPESELEPGAQDAAARVVTEAGAAGVDISEVLQQIIALASDAEAIDVHVEPTGSALLIRGRSDGTLKTVAAYPLAAHPEVLARLKLMAGLDVSERLLPQAGRMQVGAETPLVARLTTLRTAYGEKAVIRPIDRRKSVIPLDDLGFSSTALAALRQALEQPHGIVVVAGPRGSGRTTTLAAIFAELAARGRTATLITPVIDYALPGITQVPVEEAVGLTATVALAVAVAQNSDAIGIDDLRDRATANAAVRAAAEDRLVAVAVNGEDAAEAVARLMAMVDDRETLAASLRAVVAQRLLRRLCTGCRRERTPPGESLPPLQLPDVPALPLFEPTGCEQCGFVGYRGRVGIFEVLPITDRLRGLVGDRSRPVDWRAAARSDGLATLADAARGRLESGVTSAAEVRRLVDLDEARPVCTQCGTVVLPDFSACPQCGTPLGGVCQHCGRALHRGWSFCPYCARTAEDAGRPSRRGLIRLVRNPDAPNGV
jgi:type IV pilus assembly protein PilB